MKTTLHARGNALTIEYRQGGEEYVVTVGDTSLQTQVLAAHDGALTLSVGGQLLRAHVVSDGPRTFVAIDGHVYEFVRGEQKSGYSRQREAGRLSPEIRSPMPGKILDVRVAEGTNVEAGQVLVVLEAMKMENALTAEGPGRVHKIHVTVGELVELGQLLVELEFPQKTVQTD
jgi:biotin carboxyl carrier protein